MTRANGSLLIATATALGIAACFPGRGTMQEPGAVAADQDASTPDAGIPFEPSAPRAYVAKVKNVLVGMPPTDDEIAAVTQDPTALRGLIDGWMKLPQYDAKMQAFFANAFQQSQVTFTDFSDQLPQQGGMALNKFVAARLVVNARESFARTVTQLIREGRPFHEAMTTQRFMMTPPLMAMYAYVDNEHVDDDGKLVSRLNQEDPGFQFVVEASAGPIPIAQTLDPKSANYIHWYNPLLGTTDQTDPECKQDPRTYSRDPNGLYQLLMGGLTAMQVGSVKCQPQPGTATSSQFADAEFDQWKMVSVRAPNAGEATTRFFDLASLRTASELVLRVPRVGFSTPAFFAGWGTNSSNEARVTMNQTLIVALGHSFDATNSITPVSEVGLNGEHAVPGSVCFSCHQTLDPMRQFFRQAYTLAYHDQTDATQMSMNGTFAFDGVSVVGKGIGDLATQLAIHPRFAQAWAQKLCTYARSASCAGDDPELLRIAGVFRDSGFSWAALVREVLSSPIVTDATETATSAASGSTVAIARRDHLCVALAARLGLDDPCGLGSSVGLTVQEKLAALVSADLPADGYSRGSETPVLANDPTLFFRAGAENLCRLVADRAVDAPKNSKYTSTDPDGAIADFVSNVMALAKSDSRAADAATQVLKDHFDAAKQSGASASDALKSTFVLACLAPSATGLGL